MSPPAAATTLSKKTAGLLLIFLTAIIWILTSFISESLVSSSGTGRPKVPAFLLTWLATTLFTLYLPFIQIKQWIDACLKQRNPARRPYSALPVSEVQHAPSPLEVTAPPGTPSKADGQPHAPGHAQRGASVPGPHELAMNAALWSTPLWFLAQYSFNASLALTSVTSNTILSSTSSLFTFGLSVLLLGERFTLRKLACILACILGTALVTFSDVQAAAELAAPPPAPLGFQAPQPPDRQPRGHLRSLLHDDLYHTNPAANRHTTHPWLPLAREAGGQQAGLISELLGSHELVDETERLAAGRWLLAHAIGKAQPDSMLPKPTVLQAASWVPEAGSGPTDTGGPRLSDGVGVQQEGSSYGFSIVRLLKSLLGRARLEDRMRLHFGAVAGAPVVSHTHASEPLLEQQQQQQQAQEQRLNHQQHEEEGQPERRRSQEQVVLQQGDATKQSRLTVESLLFRRLMTTLRFASKPRVAAALQQGSQPAADAAEQQGVLEHTGSDAQLHAGMQQHEAGMGVPGGSGALGGGGGGGRVADEPPHQNKSPFLGDMLVLVSSALYGCYTVIMRLKMPGEEAGHQVAHFFGYVGLFTTVGLAPLVVLLLATGGIDLSAIPRDAYWIILLEGLLDYVLSDYLWARAVMLVGPTVATLSLSVQIPLAGAVELFSSSPPGWTHNAGTIAMTLAGTLCILIGFVGINLEDTSTEADGGDGGSTGPGLGVHEAGGGASSHGSPGRGGAAWVRALPGRAQGWLRMVLMTVLGRRTAALGLEKDKDSGDEEWLVTSREGSRRAMVHHEPGPSDSPT